jgi:hypothetical protein
MFSGLMSALGFAPGSSLAQPAKNEQEHRSDQYYETDNRHNNPFGRATFGT